MKFHVADWIVLKWSNKLFFITSFTTITNTTIIAGQRLRWQLSLFLTKSYDLPHVASQ